jgi:acarbose 7IV-phosphotransferase
MKILLDRNQMIKKHTFILGGTTFDHIVSLSEFPEPVPHTIHKTLFFEGVGSTGTGKALCLTKLKVPNTLYSLLGDDLFGQQIIHYLEKEHVEFIYDVDPQGTERHINMMDTQGNRISMFITQSSEFPKVNWTVVEDYIKKSDIIVLNIISYCKEFIPVLKRYKKPVWTDLHDYNDGNEYHQPFIDIADYVFLSSDNINDYKQTLRDLMQTGKELVVCTHGKNGATALTKSGEWIEEPALTGFPVVDTNGAGDNFFAGFFYAYMHEKSIRDCMRYGAICGATCVTSQQIVSPDLTSIVLEDMYVKYY